MTEYFRITGKNNILLDAGPTGNYLFTKGRPPQKLSTVLTRQEVLAVLPRLPLGIRPLALRHGLSVITMELNIWGVSDTDMEAREHDLIETLVETELFFSHQGNMGTRAVLTVKSDGAVNTSYKSVFFGVLDELDARDVLGAIIKGHSLEGLRLVLYCEPYWRPEDAVALGPNEIKTPSFEEYGGAAGLADHWVVVGTPTTTIEPTKVLHGCQSQKVETDNNSLEGIETGNIVHASETSAVAYAWVTRDDPGDDIAVELWDTVASSAVDTALLNTGGWETEVAGGKTWSRLVVSSNALTAARNYTLRIVRRLADATQITTYYVDETFWKWGTVTAPDEWIGRYLIYNHYDPATAYPAHIDHINYLDIDRLKGDVAARLLMRTEFEQKADADNALDLIVGRRTRDPPCGLVWWMEAETVATGTWGALALARCSGGSRVTDSALGAGNVVWNFPILWGIPRMFLSMGPFDVFGVVLTDDIVNTQYRLSYRFSPAGYLHNKWVKQTAASKWQMIPLGQINFDPSLRTGMQPADWRIRVEYQKDAIKTAELDCIWLVPQKESSLILESFAQDIFPIAAPPDYWVAGWTEDFEYIAHEGGTPLYWHASLHKKGSAMLTLKPDEENRLYFVCLTQDNSDKIYEAHGAATDLQMIVNIDYLPQYVSPLE